MNEFATIKVRRQTRTWLKRRAAELQIPMYALIEQLIEDGAAEAAPGQLPARGPLDMVIDAREQVRGGSEPQGGLGGG